MKRLLLAVCFFGLLTVTNKVFASRKATAASPNVEVYSAPNFDAQVVEIIQPGARFEISDQTTGPFYKVKFSNGRVGYIADTEVDIEGVGRFKERPFDGPESLQKKSKLKKKLKDDVVQDESDDESDERLSYRAITYQLVNFHEETMGGIQVGDLQAFGFRSLPALSDMGTSTSWDVAAAFSPPNYYKEKTGYPAKGFVVWGGVELVNLSGISSQTSMRYGAGAFARYNQFNVQSSVKKFSLQDLTVGVLLEGGVIFHINDYGLDLGMRYYWDKKPYGALGIAFLF